MSDADDFGEIEAYLASAPVLQRVIQAKITHPARMGGRLVVTSVEIWTTLIVVHYATVGSEAMQWHGVQPEDPDFATWQLAQQRALQLVDDVGNTYPLASGGGGGGGDPAMPIVHYQSSYTGPVDERASALLFWPAQSARSEPARIPLT